MSRDEEIEIASDDFWFKVVEFLQQNWALVHPLTDGVRVFFLGDTAGVFDEIHFNSLDDAEAALRRNGFAKFNEDPRAKEFLSPHERPFWRSVHPNGPIYSSGRFWR